MLGSSPTSAVAGWRNATCKCAACTTPDPLREVDLFASMPSPFDDLVADGTVIVVDGVEVRVASLAHLTAMKESSACRRVPSHGHPRSSASVG